MEEHEVPTHVQAEDRVLLWFTFPQIVALTAVAALATASTTTPRWGRRRRGQGSRWCSPPSASRWSPAGSTAGG